MTIKTAALALPLLFAGWLTTLIAVGLFTDAAPASVVLFPTENFLQNLPDDVAIISSTRFTLTLSAETKNFARTLYSSGAWIVLPAGLTGCLPLPKPS